MLKGCFYKAFKYQTIVTADILLKIDNYLKTRNATIVYNFDTTNGAMYETNDIQDILQYPNNSNSKIERITINGKREGKYSLQGFIILKFFDKGIWDDSASLFINEASSDEITGISKDLIDIITQAKAPYSWVYSKWILLFLNLLLSGILSIVLYTYLVPLIKENNASWWIEVTIFQMLILVIIFKGFMKAIEWAYPETVFSIGEQDASYKKLLSRRNKIIGGLSTIILGVISSIIASKFIN